MKNIKELFAFVHIEKAAGSTLNAIIEENFTYRHCRIVPLRKRFPVVFNADDMMIVQRINPFVEAISGHPVRPFSDLDSIRKVRYFTLLRDPVYRYLSHYQHWVEKNNNHLSFEDFLEIELVQNFQTKKIAGSDDVEAAKKYLDNFFLVGVVEDFDCFLKVLQKKMAPRKFCIQYEMKNIGTKKTVNRVLSDIDNYKDRILENNRLDKELYHYAKKLFEKEKKQHLPSLDDVDSVKYKKKYLWRFFKKFYYTQMINVIRMYYARKEGE